MAGITVNRNALSPGPSSSKLVTCTPGLDTDSPYFARREEGLARAVVEKGSKKCAHA